MKGPTESSSKKPVSAIREIPGLKKKSNLYMDPRFDAARGEADLTQVRQNYKFLDQYREDEIRHMSQQLKKVKNEQEREEIEAAIKSQKSRLETFKNKDQEQAILRGIKNKKITRAKKRELVLKARFDNMTSRERGSAIEKRRRKVAQKQKKLLPRRRE